MLEKYVKHLKNDNVNKIKKLCLFILTIFSFLSIYSTEIKGMYNFDMSHLKPYLLIIVLILAAYLILETGFVMYHNKNNKKSHLEVNNTTYMLLCGFIIVCLIT